MNGTQLNPGNKRYREYLSPGIYIRRRGNHTDKIIIRSGKAIKSTVTGDNPDINGKPGVHILGVPVETWRESGGCE